MKIYFPHSGLFDYESEFYYPIKQSRAYSKHKCILPHDTSNEPLNTIQKTSEFDIIIAECSFPSTGMGIELGWANALNKRIICLCKKGTNPSSSLKTITSELFEYEVDSLSNLLDQIIP